MTKEYIKDETNCKIIINVVSRINYEMGNIYMYILPTTSGNDIINYIYNNYNGFLICLCGINSIIDYILIYNDIIIDLSKDISYYIDDMKMIKKPPRLIFISKKVYYDNIDKSYEII
jgi:hypothetical protein